MADERADISFMMMVFLWLVIRDSSAWLNIRFKQLIPSEEALASMFQQLDFTFCVGLLGVLCQLSPPDLKYLKSLPKYVPKDAWGVYVLVFKQPGHIPLIYIGSGTGQYRGLRARLTEHRTGKNIPKYVRLWAYDAGYTMTHVAVLAHCAIPAPGDAVWVRSVILALEAALSCIFWAMCSRTKSYGFSHLCPWDRNAFQYGGLCSHSSVKEGIPDDHDATPEELEEKAAAIEEKNRLYMAEYGKKQRANATAEFKAAQKRRNKNHRPKVLEKEKITKASKKFHCKLCNSVYFKNNADYQQHLRGPRHLLNVATNGKPNHCVPCNKTFKYPNVLKIHETKQCHLDMVASQSASST
jgi:hypothetical protein